MTDVEQIAKSLTKAQREAVLIGQSEHVSMPMRLISVIRRLCWSTSRRGVLFTEGYVGFLTTFRLTPLGLAVRAHLSETSHDR